MAANVRFSSNSVGGKNYLGGALITGTSGIYNPNNVTTNAIFDKILKSENMAGTEDYRCLYFVNDYTNQTIYEPSIQITASQPSNAIFTMGFLTDKNIVAQAIDSEVTAPDSIIFDPTTSVTNLIKGSDNQLLPGEYVAFWIKRKAANTSGSGTITGEMQFRVTYRM